MHKIYNGYYYWGRPSMAELHDDLRAATREVRPDWDPTAPELREKWTKGDKQDFYPYGIKSMEQTLKEMAGAVDQYAGAANEPA